MVAGNPTVPDPPDPFNAYIDMLRVGEQIYRAHSNTRTVAEFNPGYGSPTRFAFFPDRRSQVVPVLYAAATEEAAVAESLLHDIPHTGGALPYNSYASTVMGRLSVTRDLRLARLRGTGLRRLKVTATELTDTAASAYPRTVQWARAAHHAGFDGLSWTSRRCNDAQAIVLFGDRCLNAVEQDPSFGRLFQSGEGLDWLISMCAPLHVDVLPPAL